MKKMIFATLVFVAMLSISCTEDFTDPKNLNGTTWRCSNFSDTASIAFIEYYDLKFTSTTAGEQRIKLKEVAVSAIVDFTYTISGDKISILSVDQTSVGTIDKKTLTLIQDGEALVFTKQ